MNGNIEVVNENLWCVNQHYVHAGYIKELTLLPGTSLDKEIYLTNQGILVLNTAAPALKSQERCCCVLWGIQMNNWNMHGRRCRRWKPLMHM